MRAEHSGACSVLFVTVSAFVLLIIFVHIVYDDYDDREFNPSETRATNTLRFIVVVSRHGNRGGIGDYVSDPYPLSNPHYWPYGSSGLTPRGRVQMYELGARVRALYDGFLNSSFYPEEVHASSTYMDRMLMSGEAFLAGLYPPRGWQLWDTALPWQPTPLYSDSPDNTVRILRCPRFLAELVKGVNTSNNMAAIKDLLHLYNQAAGRDTSDFTELFFLWDKLISEETEGFALPSWTARLYPEPLANLVTDLYKQTFAGTDEIIRLLIGDLYGEIRDALVSKASGRMQTLRRIHYYSGHDSTLIALQALLGVPWSSIEGLIKPSSVLILELHQHPVSGRHGVQLLYIDGGSPNLELTPLPVSGCEVGEVCPLSYLLNRTTKFTPVNFSEECTLGSSEYTATDALSKFKRFIYKYTQ